MLKWGISKSKKSKAEKRSPEINNILLVSAQGFQASGDRLNNSISFFFPDSTVGFGFPVYRGSLQQKGNE